MVLVQVMEPGPQVLRIAADHADQPADGAALQVLDVGQNDAEIQAVLARGAKVTGATVHFVDEGTDTGPIILQKAVAVQQDDTPEVLQRRVMEEAEWEILPEAIALIAAGAVSVRDGRVFIDRMGSGKEKR